MTRYRRPALVGVCVLVAATAYLIAHAFSGGDHPARQGAVGGVTGSHQAANAQTPGASHEPPRPAGSATRAVDAAVAYLDLVDDPASVADASRSLTAITLQPLTTTAEKAVGAVTALAQRLDSHGAVFLRGWRLGWSIRSLTRQRAQVAIWTMGTVAGTVEVIAPVWSTTTCALRWSSGRWKVTSAQTSPGPTPPTPEASHYLVAKFVRAASRFQAFTNAP
jgi:hypothetical protein